MALQAILGFIFPTPHVTEASANALLKHLFDVTEAFSGGVTEASLGALLKHAVVGSWTVLEPRLRVGASGTEEA